MLSLSISIVEDHISSLGFTFNSPIRHSKTDVQFLTCTYMIVQMATAQMCPMTQLCMQKPYQNMVHSKGVKSVYVCVSVFKHSDKLMCFRLVAS